MSDNGDGTYSYSLVALESGPITIKILHATEGIDSYFYANRYYTDPPEIHNVTSEIDYDWGSGGPGSVTDNFSTILNFYFVPEESTNYIFNLSGNHYSFLYLKGALTTETFVNSSDSSVNETDNIL